jgi:ABC-type multidrug transport system ATPase subunit
LREDKGRVNLSGRVGGLIELGAGFHSYLSGRENVFINGAILGMRQREIRAKYDSIVEFAGLSEFMDMQVKNYSSGMYARLAFAVAAHAQPDILLVDEVLAVGDNAFQMKCYEWMGEQRKKGTTIVLVSHAMTVVSTADRCLYLRSGEQRRIGPSREVCDQYQAELLADPVKAAGEIHEGERGLRIERVQMFDKDGRELEAIEHESDVRVRIHYNCAQPLAWPVFEFGLFHDDPRYPVHIPSHYLFSAFSGDAFKDLTISGKGFVDVALESVRLPVGRYRLKVILFERAYTHPLFVWDGIARIEARRPAWSDGRALIDCRQSWSAPVEVKVS